MIGLHVRGDAEDHFALVYALEVKLKDAREKVEFHAALNGADAGFSLYFARRVVVYEQLIKSIEVVA